jgi:hypothetical protein
MSKMGLHDPFRYLKHKLWSKKGSRVRLVIWLPTTKSQESPRFPYVQVVCNTLLESSWQGLYLLQTSFQSEVYTQSYGPPKLQTSELWKFRTKWHLGANPMARPPHKVMGPQSCRSSSYEDFGQNDIWVLVPWPDTEYIIRGKVVASPKFGPWWVLWVCVCPWLVHAPKCFNHALTNLLFGLCKFVWIIELFINLPNPIPKLQQTPLPPKCYEPRSAPQLLFLPLSSPLDSQLSPSRSLGMRHSQLNPSRSLGVCHSQLSPSKELGECQLSSMQTTYAIHLPPITFSFSSVRLSIISLTSMLLIGLNFFNVHVGTWSSLSHLPFGILSKQITQKHEMLWHWNKVGSLLGTNHIWCILMPQIVS